jgi:hypothetical protein
LKEVLNQYDSENTHQTLRPAQSLNRRQEFLTAAPQAAKGAAERHQEEGDRAIRILMLAMRQTQANSEYYPRIAIESRRRIRFVPIDDVGFATAMRGARVPTASSLLSESNLHESAVNYWRASAWESSRTRCCSARSSGGG